jgi:hypothetical protein
MMNIDIVIYFDIDTPVHSELICMILTPMSLSQECLYSIDFMGIHSTSMTRFTISLWKLIIIITPKLLNYI